MVLEPIHLRWTRLSAVCLGFRKPNALAFTGSKFKLDVLTFDITEVAHAFAEVIPERQIANHADQRQRALRTRRKRPRNRCAAEQRDEVAAPQLFESHQMPRARSAWQDIELASAKQRVFWQPMIPGKRPYA
jgi:hypothetical protein